MRDQRGSAALEVVLVTPLLLLLLMFIVGLGRLASSRGEVDGAARDAARAASIARTPPAAADAARAVASATLADRSITCAQLDVAVDTSDFRPGGSVSVNIACAVRLNDLAGTGFGSSRVLHGEAIAVIDTYRSAG